MLDEEGQDPLVSVVMCVYNERIDFLRESVESILNQTFARFRLIIVDDSDDDEVVSHLEQVASEDDRLDYVHNPERLGFVRSLNLGLSRASTDLIARVDSDDVMVPDRLERQVQYLSSHPEVGIVGSSFHKINERGQRLGVRRYPSSSRQIERAMTMRSALAHPTVMMRRNVIDLIGPYDESFSRAEDYDLWMRAMSHGIRMANIPEPLMLYRVYQVDRRDRTHWRNNLKIKFRYFERRFMVRRIIGILVVGLVWLLPLRLKDQAYQLYNRIG